MIILSMSISNYIALVETSAFLIGNTMISGIAACTVIGSYLASYQITNNYIIPVFIMVYTENP